MKRLVCFVVLTFALIVGLLVFMPRRASAITYGYVDSTNTFRETGAFLVKSTTTGEISPICSGTMITANVFLTAGHCTSYFTDELAPDGYVAYVSLDQSIPFGELSSNSTQLLAVSYVVTNPNYSQRQSDSGDIGVLILQHDVAGVTPATLPACGLLDQMAAKNGLKDAVFTAVGYGVQNRMVGGGTPFFQDLNPVPRMFAFSTFNALNGGYLRLSQNPAKGDGGTCFGDSGGPNFLSAIGPNLLSTIGPTSLPPTAEHLVVAITITGDSVCRATNVDYRLDTPSAQGFLAYVNAAFGTSIPLTC